MKHEIRLLVPLFLLLWLLAWSAAGRSAAPAAPSPEEEKEEPPAPAEPAPAHPDSERELRVLVGGSVERMPMDDYLVGVMRAEMPASFEPEALKAQAIAARTYTLYKMKDGPIPNHPEADACDDITCCKAYKTAAEAAADWGGLAVYYEEKLRRAVADTDAQVVLYDGEPILAVFCSSVDGRTQNAGAVWQSDLPYLQSVDSPETADLVPNYYSSDSFSADGFRALFLAAHPEADLSGPPESWFRDLTRGEAGYVASLTVGGVTLRGSELRGILSLRSPSFTVEPEADGVTFRVTGYGHGVGMSQYGANILAGQGMDAAAILEHYYAGARVGTY